MSPYWNQDIWGFIAAFAGRVPALLCGAEAASDEVQIAVLGLIAIACGVLGPLLVLKRMAMLANSLSHTMLLGLGIAYVSARSLFGCAGGLTGGHLILGAFIAALLTINMTSLLTRRLRLQEDASIGIAFTSLFALGISFVTLFTRDIHLGVEVVMGNADMLQPSDALLAACLAAAVLLAVFILFWPLQCIAFDPGFSSSAGISCKWLRLFLFLLTAAASVGAFRAVGVLLVLSLLTGPYLIARLFCHSLWKLLFLSPLIGLLASFLGVALSRHLLTVTGYALSTGGIVSVLLALLYILAWARNCFTARKRSAKLLVRRDGLYAR